MKKYAKSDYGELRCIAHQFNQSNITFFSTWISSGSVQMIVGSLAIGYISDDKQNGCLVTKLSGFVTHEVGNPIVFAILAASASCIAVLAVMRLIVPKADPELYIPMALDITFTFNITEGMPLYYALVTNTF